MIENVSVSISALIATRVHPSPAASPPGPYWVLSTDYEGHSLVYGCTDYGLFHMEFAWILSRQPSLPEETIEELHSIMAASGISVHKLTSTNQDEAFCKAMNQ